jgi:two-component system chemotaxis response regulator CheB
VANLARLGPPSGLTCPDCGGGLNEISQQPLRYRCHTGHAFTALALEQAQAELADQALWNGLRVMRERELLLLRLASAAEGVGQSAQARVGREQARKLRESSLQLSRMLEEGPA